MHTIAFILFIISNISPQQSAIAQVSGGMQIVWQKPMDRSADICAMSAGGRWAMTTDGYNIRVRDMESGDVVHDIIGPVAMCLEFGKDSTTYVTITGSSPFRVSTVSTATGTVVDTAIGPTFYGTLTAVHPFADRTRWVISTHRGLYVYNSETRQVDTFYVDSSSFYHPIGNIGGAKWIGISDDETQIYTCGTTEFSAESPDRLCAWDITTRKQTYQKEASSGFSWIPLSTPRSRFIIGWIRSGGYPDGSVVELYDLRTGTLVKHVPSFTRRVIQGMSLSADGRYLAYQTTSGAVYSIQVVDTESGQILGECRTPYVSRIHQFLPTESLDLYAPSPDTFSLRLRIDPTTDVKPDASGQTLQCSVVPNPGVGSVAVNITLAEPAAVTLRLVTSDGKVVQESDLGFMDAGTHTVPARATAGYYQCTVTAGGASSSFPIIIR